MSGWALILVLLVLGGVLSTLGDRLGSRVGKARLSLFSMRPRRTNRTRISAQPLIAAQVGRWQA